MVAIGTWNVENLYLPGGEFGPKDVETYRAKLRALQSTIARLDVDVLAVQEVGSPEAAHDLARLLGDEWRATLSDRPDGRGIRVGVLSRVPVRVVADTTRFPTQLRPVQINDAGDDTGTMGRGAFAVEADLRPGLHALIITCHLKSKLLSFPPLHGQTRPRFSPKDEGERARFGTYALSRRAAEATTVRALADELLREKGRERAVVLLGDLNDEVPAATTQILLGPPGSELGTAGAQRPDRGDASRLWNLAPLMPEQSRYSRIYRGRRELIDHILVSHTLLRLVKEVAAVVDRTMPSIDDDPAVRREVTDSDHAPVVVRFG